MRYRINSKGSFFSFSPPTVSLPRLNEHPVYRVKHLSWHWTITWELNIVWKNIWYKPAWFQREKQSQLITQHHLLRGRGKGLLRNFKRVFQFFFLQIPIFHEKIHNFCLKHFFLFRLQMINCFNHVYDYLQRCLKLCPFTSIPCVTCLMNDWCTYSRVCVSMLASILYPLLHVFCNRWNLSVHYVLYIIRWKKSENVRSGDLVGRSTVPPRPPQRAG